MGLAPPSGRAERLALGQVTAASRRPKIQVSVAQFLGLGVKVEALYGNQHPGWAE